MSMTIGELFKISIFGESHGAAIGCVIEGVPAGKEIPMDYITLHMKRRAARPKGDDATAGIRCARIFIRRL